ncbi:MAG TPA: S1 RNA-binding domain-containing protein [Blastocatellia bacterium]|nr:S1 RNA-binding domain-containing protein [Blastocatellia bacterium]
MDSRYKYIVSSATREEYRRLRDRAARLDMSVPRFLIECGLAPMRMDEGPSLRARLSSESSRSVLSCLHHGDDPQWDIASSRYRIGMRVSGVVRHLASFAAFVEIAEGIVALLQVRDISRKARIKHPSDVLWRGQRIEAIVTGLDLDRRRITLSMKDLESTRWQRFFDTHRKGDLVYGRLVRLGVFWAVVELEPRLEALCHVSQLGPDAVDHPDAAVQDGQAGLQTRFTILTLNPRQCHVTLSAAAAPKSVQLTSTLPFPSAVLPASAFVVPESVAC